jgi:hypothetical protein
MRLGFESTGLASPDVDKLTLVTFWRKNLADSTWSPIDVG